MTDPVPKIAVLEPTGTRALDFFPGSQNSLDGRLAEAFEHFLKVTRSD
jgi:hypothetical protein